MAKKPAGAATEIMSDPLVLALLEQYRFRVVKSGDSIDAAGEILALLDDEAALQAYLLGSPISNIETLRAILRAVTDATRKAMLSSTQSRYAAGKNAKPRAWVQEQYRSHGSEFKSKAAFARAYLDKVNARFSTSDNKRLQISAQQIADDWLNPKALNR